ncbi:MAG: ArsR family transcriptional regulator [Ruminococcaceae bacterium]|nr:ArsR family transcriptional regulator [Oscillospiraceae bacterium]
MEINKLNDLSDIFQSKLRLMIISALMTGKKTFKEIKVLTNATDGNISVQITNMEKAGFVMVTKTYMGKKPQTIIEITEYGKIQFKNYIDTLNAILNGS